MQRALGRRTLLFAGAAAAIPAAAASARLETLSDWVRAGRKARRLALQPCVDRIHTLDDSIHAWVQVLPQNSTGSGKLAEIPFGVKDVIETRGLATEYGSPIYKGRIGTTDAAIVTELRGRGAVLLGKTYPTAFAHRDPPPTRNPRNLEHTPGGSSSGSAAAVAAGMVPFALGTQTLGSVLRPASYCGVTGFKPSYGLFSMEGVLPLAPSFDTLGFFTNTPADMLALWESLGRPTGAASKDDRREETFALGAPDPVPQVEPEMRAAFQAAVSTLRKSGISIRPLDLSPLLAKLADAANTVLAYEGARVHKERFDQYGDRLGQIAVLVREGRQISDARYEEARQYIAQRRAQMTEYYKATPVILVPAATGPAPLGLSYTGDASMNSPWTAMGVPAITIPMPVSGGLPLGLQLTAAPGSDGRVLRMAVRLYGVLNAK